MLRHFIAVLVLALPACGGSPTDSSLASLMLRTETVGAELDPDGYTLQLDAQEPRPIGLTDSILVQDIAAGQHTVALEGLAANCSTAEQNPLEISISATERADITITVICLGSTGSLSVRTFTQGSGGPVDGFVVAVDGIETRSIPQTGSVGFILPAGTHEILLGNLTAECTVNGDNPQIVTIGPQESVRITFLVDCTGTG